MRSTLLIQDFKKPPVVLHKKRDGWGEKETFGGGGYVYYLVVGDDFVIYTYVQTHQIISSKYMQFFVYQLYFKAVKNIKIKKIELHL